MMQDLQIVTHCYAGSLPQYAQHLRFQLAGMYYAAPNFGLVATICYTPEDRLTCDVLDDLEPIISTRYILHRLPLAPEHLYRRAIGRDRVAQEPRAKRIWYTDVDYIPGIESMRSVLRNMPEDGTATSAGYYINTTHELGDNLVAQTADDRLPRIQPDMFSWRRNRIAIGGVQMIGAQRLHTVNGYLHGTKWTQPVDPNNGFLRCRCDTHWRRSNALKFDRIETPDLYRIRHSHDGRDYDGDGRRNK